MTAHHISIVVTLLRDEESLKNSNGCMDSSFYRNDLGNGRDLSNHRVNKGFDSIVRQMATSKDGNLRIAQLRLIARVKSHKNKNT